MKKLMIAAALAAVTMGASAASALEYHVTYSVGANLADEFFTTSGTANASGFFLVTGLTGTFGGASISLLAPGTFPANGLNDNLFDPTSPYLTYDGVSFTTGSAKFNLFNNSPGVFQCSGNCNLNGVPVSNFTVTAVTSAVPEPVTWMMMLTGLGMVGLVARRGRNVRVTYS